MKLKIESNCSQVSIYDGDTKQLVASKFENGNIDQNDDVEGDIIEMINQLDGCEITSVEIHVAGLEEVKEQRKHQFQKHIERNIDNRPRVVLN